MNSAGSRFGFVSRGRRGFTLVELLITVSIIGIMASMVLFALFSAQEQAREQKTRALIAKLNNIVLARYDSYRTRRVPIHSQADQYVDSNTDGIWNPGEQLIRDWNGNDVWDDRPSAKDRLDVLRDLMRMEMPDRWSDVYDGAATPFDDPANPPGRKVARPALSRAYFQKYQQVTGGTGPPADVQNQGAECLYMIVMEAIAQEGDAREVFRPDDVADTDGDGFPEFVDAWGQPIRFLRWAPGFTSELHQIARVIPDTVTPNPPLVTIQIDTPAKLKQFSTDASRYLFGTVAVLDVDGRIVGDRMGRITGYQYDDGSTPNDLTDDVVTITCETTVSGVAPFAGGAPTTGETIVLMGPDPFDPRGVYPIPSALSGTTDTEPQTFALYPLIYSSGPDRADGIASKLTTGFSYASVGLNPFYILPDGSMIGSFLSTSMDPNFYVGCWNDNIHNHQLNMR